MSGLKMFSEEDNMKGWVPRKLCFGCIIGLAFLITVPLATLAERPSMGNIIGFVYAKDGTTPLEGATVKFKNLASSSIYESSKTDGYGIFKIQGVESGVYTYGVVTNQGDFNASNIVGLKVSENETAKMSIAIQPFSRDEAAAVTEIYKDQDKSGESLVAMVADFDAATGMAQLQMVKGLLRVSDKIHARGQSTDFYQEVGVLKIGDSSAQQILGSQAGAIKLDRNVEKGDRVYLVQNKKIFPFFLAPAGIAAVVAGNSAITYGVVKITDKSEPVSAFKN